MPSAVGTGGVLSVGTLPLWQSHFVGFTNPATLRYRDVAQFKTLVSSLHVFILLLPIYIYIYCFPVSERCL